MISQSTTLCVLLLVALCGLECANAQRSTSGNTADTMSLAKAFLDQNAANLVAANKLLAQLNDKSVTDAEKQVAVQVGIQQVRLPLIAEFKAAAGASSLAVTPNGGAPAAAAGTAAANGTKPVVSACVQKTHDQVLQELAKFPWNLDIQGYRALCNRDPTNEIACMEKTRNFKREDYNALLEAKRLGIELKMPCVPVVKTADYEVGDPFNVTSSGIPRQFEGAKKLKELMDRLANLTRRRTTTVATEEPTTESTTTASTTTRATEPGETTVATTTATTTTTTKRPTTTPSARPTIRRVNGLLQIPAGQPNAGRTIYFFRGESTAAQQCQNGCENTWPAVNGLRIEDWDLDPAAACAGSAANTLGAFPSAASPVSGVQLSCGNHPLYLFMDDRNPGDRKGLTHTGGFPFELA